MARQANEGEIRMHAHEVASSFLETDKSRLSKLKNRAGILCASNQMPRFGVKPMLQ